MVILSPEGKVLIIFVDGIVSRTATGVWSNRAPDNFKIEDIASWKIIQGDEEKELIISASAALGPIPRRESNRLVPGSLEHKVMNRILAQDFVDALNRAVLKEDEEYNKKSKNPFDESS